MTSRPPQPSFMIVGTPRSGTTLVQRLACELEGVWVPPETHFFSDFALGLHRRHRFPLEGAALREALQLYASQPYLRGVELDVDAILATLAGSCPSMLHLFSAIVGHLAGEAVVVGEKTPGHLLWWRELASALPAMRFVLVVRDPRAVVASYQRVGWGGTAVLNAQRWCYDARVTTHAARALGPGRALLLRYEDVVADPAATRARLAAFLGVVVASPAELEVGADPRVLFPSWEQWKADALEPIDVSRVTEWQDLLRPAQVDQVVALTRRHMRALGYPGAPSARRALRTQLRIPVTEQLKRLHREARRLRSQHAIARVARTWGEPEGPGDSG